MLQFNRVWVIPYAKRLLLNSLISIHFNNREGSRRVSREADPGSLLQCVAVRGQETAPELKHDAFHVDIS